LQQAPPQQQVSGPWHVLQQAILQQSAEAMEVEGVAAVGAAAVMAMASPRAAMMDLNI